MLNRFHLWKADSANWPEQVSIKDRFHLLDNRFFLSVFYLECHFLLWTFYVPNLLNTYLGQPRWDKLENWFRRQTNKNQLCNLPCLRVKINYMVIYAQDLAHEEFDVWNEVPPQSLIPLWLVGWPKLDMLDLIMSRPSCSKGD